MNKNAAGGGGHKPLHEYPGLLAALLGKVSGDGYSSDDEDSNDGEETYTENDGEETYTENEDESITITYISDRTRSKTAPKTAESGNVPTSSSSAKSGNASIKKTKSVSKSSTKNAVKTVKITRSKKQKVILIPGIEVPASEVPASEGSEKCHSTNYLELLTAFYFCFKITTYDGMLPAFNDVLEDAQKNLGIKGKYNYRNKIIFSNAKRAINHCENFKKNVTSTAFFKRQVDNTLDVLNSDISYEFRGIPDTINAYIGYIPLEATKYDADPEKFQNPTDVCLLLKSKEFLNISCKATSDCPLTNWWWVNYLHHCGFEYESDYFQTLMDERIASVDIEKWNDETKDATGKKNKDRMRDQWNLEDKKTRSEYGEPVFRDDAPMWQIQRVMKANYETILTHAMSDIFTQTVYYPVYLLAGGDHPLFLNLSNHSPDRKGINVNFKHHKSTHSESAKFIFGVTVVFRDITVNFIVEIRRSGEINNYRIHFKIEGIEPTRTKRGGSRKHKCKSLRRRKSRRSKKN